GVVGIIISFTLGLLLGGAAGYFGGFTDTVIMRLTELLLSIPSLYLIIALRAVFPVDLPSRQIYLGIVGILAFIGWAGLARVIRGLTAFPWLLVVPGAAIFLTVMAFNFLGDGLRDALDPRRVSGGKA